MNVVMLDYIWLIIFILMNNLSILGKIDAIEKDYSHCTRIVQSLKRSTFPFLRSFNVRSPSVHRAFSVRSSCVHRSQFCVQRSPFARDHRSQSVQRSLTVRSPIVHKAFIVHSAFSLHCHSEL